jgi:hypothetical protein
MTMRLARLATILALFALLVSTGTSSAASGAPTGLHGFLLRADEQLTGSFHRTPSFAWDPFPAAIAYQFQLSTSSSFRDNAVVYNTNGLRTPIAAPSLALPWITGSPHSLYARVRATLDDGDVTPWSDDYGFDVVAPPPPTPLPLGAEDSGLLRWTPVEGATSYIVWLVDAPLKAGGFRFVTAHTNVIDEREFYTFHPTTQWMGTVRWRIRAVRSIEAGAPRNGLPATSFGAWSPIYKSTNPALQGGAITPLHTVSDVISDGTGGASAHRLMPAFTWKGTQTISGQTAELFRVYAFTDRDCLNQVYASPPIGSPAYAPRTSGPLALPSDSAGIASARGSFLDPGVGASGEMYDGTPVSPQETLPAAAPTTTAPADDGPADPSGATPAPGAAAPPAGGSGSSASSSGPGAPVDLWDTDTWPKGGYYWTVVGVGPVQTATSASSVAAPGASKGSTLVPVADVSSFQAGQSVTIGVAPDSDTATIGAVGNGLITLTAPLNNGHAVGEPVASTQSGSVAYRDLELPQDVCKVRHPSWMPAGESNRFGISSEPPLMAADDPFATGLSPKGRLISAARPATFYGQPLIAWAPILSAYRYEVQWSKRPYPFKAESSVMTASTALVLPVGIGTWYYRVRAFDDNLPTGSQQLSWSDTEKLTVAPPTFKVTAVKVTPRKFKVLP